MFFSNPKNPSKYFHCVFLRDGQPARGDRESRWCFRAWPVSRTEVQSPGVLFYLLPCNLGLLTELL